MIITSRIPILGILSLSLLLVFESCKTPKTDIFQVGFASSDITPSDGKIYDPLLAKALVLKQGNITGAIVVCDIMDIEYEAVVKARSIISSKTDIPAENISISCTHNHAGGDCENISERIAQSVIDARKVLIPVIISSGKTIQQGISFNRRFLMVDGTVRMNPGFDSVTKTSFENGWPYLNKEIIGLWLLLIQICRLFFSNLPLIITLLDRLHVLRYMSAFLDMAIAQIFRVFSRGNYLNITEMRFFQSLGKVPAEISIIGM